MTSLSSRMGTVIKEEHLLADVSAMMSSELRHHCNHYFFFLSCLRDMFPELPVQPSTECTLTDTLNSDPFFIFDGTCHRTQSQTNRRPSKNCHSRRGKPLPTSILPLSNFSLTPSVHSFPVINPRCDKAVPHPYPRRKGI